MKDHAKIGIGAAALAALAVAGIALTDTAEAPATEALSDTCEVAQAHGSPEAWQAIGVEPPPRGYGVIESCAVVPDGGQTFASERAAGLTITEGTPVKKEPRGNREKKARAWGKGAPFDCACRSVSDVAGACKADLGEGNGPAPFGRYLPAGTWSGPCVRQPCDFVAGADGTPDECRPPEAGQP